MRKGTKLFGNFLEEYRIIEHIADGGNSKVFKVEDSTGNKYALKLLNKDISSEKMKRFKNEIGFCIKTTHPNIIKIIDNGITDDKTQMFYIMPYYDKTLRKYIDEEHSKEEKIQMFIKILEGVNYFHKKDIIHRDIKPENILISDEDNIPIISDFGIAHFCEDDMVTQIETRVGSRMANFQYASPEQREKGGVITKKSDIYALGLIFNELFTKKIPFGNSYIKVVDVDEKLYFLDNVIDKMISQNPRNRFDCIDDIIHEINALITINEKDEEIKRLKEIKYEESEETDILILEPPKLIDFKYNDDIGKLFLYLDKNVNEEWVNCITKGSYGELLGYGPERFRFENNIAMVNLSPSGLNNLQQIINYFKSWVKNANTHYSIQVTNRRRNEKQRKENEIQNRIKRHESVKKALENIHI